MRSLHFLAAFALVSCGQGTESGERKPGPAAGDDSKQAAAPADDRIPCATDGAQSLGRVCTLDRAAGPNGEVLTVYSPRGSFRRLLVTQDGRGVTAADGAERAKVTLVSPSEIEVAIGGDRYRLPAHTR